jgi:F0F1-type ATP synthase delta subunit
MAMSPEQLQEIIDSPTSTASQKKTAQALLSQQAPVQADSGTNVMLVMLRKRHLQMLLASTDAKDKQVLKDWSHNWPDYFVTGKVLGEE